MFIQVKGDNPRNKICIMHVKRSRFYYFQQEAAGIHEESYWVSGTAEKQSSAPAPWKVNYTPAADSLREPKSLFRVEKRKNKRSLHNEKRHEYL